MASLAVVILLALSLSLCSTQSSGEIQSCTDDEVRALVAIKEDLASSERWLSSWHGKNCCNWTGVRCDFTTGFVDRLDLRYPDDFPSQISKINPSISDLVHLKFLEISMFNLSGSPIMDFVASLVELEHLVMFGNQISEEIPDFFNKLTKLKELNFSSNCITGRIPESVGNLEMLETLDLSNNLIIGEIPRKIRNLSSLKYLDLSCNSIHGEIPAEFGSLNELKHLNLSFNSLIGSIPGDVGKLCNLEELDFSNNGMSGEIKDFFYNLSNCFSSGGIRLQILFLQNNDFSGGVPGVLGEMNQLKALDFSQNSLSGVLNESHFAKLANLRLLDLSHNLLQLRVSVDWIPVFQAKNIKLNSCKLGERFPAWLRTQAKLKVLSLSGTEISDEIPTWFWNLTSYIDIFNASSNNLRGNLPANIPIIKSIFDVSSNQLTGMIPSFNSSIYVLDFSNNFFSSKIPAGYATFDGLLALSLSHNQITGSIPPFFCNLSGLRILRLSDNRMTGPLPDCWNKSLPLQIFDLSNNNFLGQIPNSLGNLARLESLHIGNNSLHGEVPSTMMSYKQLVTLDLSINMISGSVPIWIGENLSSLKALSLRSNKLSGNIPSQLALLKFLQVLDLSQNKLSGNIPATLGSLRAMANFPTATKPMLAITLSMPRCSESLVIRSKTVQLKYTVVLPFVTIIDLSGNKLSGNIPDELVKLVDIRFLNLSNNDLVGGIPGDIGRMRQLETLDLSHNKLSGKIPNSLGAISSLSQLGLSYNNLSGRIPSGTQLQSFESVVYSENVHLCGPPVSSQCPDDYASQSQSEEDYEDPSKILWVYIGLLPGFVVGLSLFISMTLPKTTQRVADVSLLDRISDELFRVVCKSTVIRSWALPPDFEDDKELGDDDSSETVILFSNSN